MLNQRSLRQSRCHQAKQDAGTSVGAPRPVSRRTTPRVVCMQGGQDSAIAPGRGPFPQQPMQPQQPAQQPYYPQQPQYGAQPSTAAPSQAGALARRPMAALQRPAVPQQAVYIEMSQVVGKQVITRTTGRNLGVISAMWVDPVRYEVVSLDLDDKKGVGSTRICNFPLSRLTQIGDVVLVHDEEVLYDQSLDGRYGYYLLTGMEVRTRSGEFLGKVRDFTFSPDNGAIARIVYDDFGLSFLPVAFFDTYSIAMNDVISLGVGGLIVTEEARYRERRESPGLFAAIPSLLRSLNSGTGRVAGALTDGYRQDGGAAGYLPQGYSYAQWEADVRRWEQETGMSYDQYTRMMAQQQQQAQQAQLQLPANAAGARQQRPGPPRALPGAAGNGQPQQQQQQNGYAARPQQQQGAGGYGGYGGQAAAPAGGQYGYAAPAGGQRAGNADPRSRVGLPQDGRGVGRVGPGPGMQQTPQQQQQQYGVSPAGPQAAPQPGWPQQQPLPPQQQQQRPPQQQQQPQYAPQAGGGAGPSPQQPQYAQQPQQQPPQQQQQQQPQQGNGMAQQGMGSAAGAPALERSPEPGQPAFRQPAEQWMAPDGKRAPEAVADSGWATSGSGKGL